MREVCSGTVAKQGLVEQPTRHATNKHLRVAVQGYYTSYYY